MSQTTFSTSSPAGAGQRGKAPQRITQAQLQSYWQCRRLVEKLENQVRAGAVAEPGPLSLPVFGTADGSPLDLGGDPAGGPVTQDEWARVQKLKAIVLSAERRRAVHGVVE